MNRPSGRRFRTRDANQCCERSSRRWPRGLDLRHWRCYTKLTRSGCILFGQLQIRYGLKESLQTRHFMNRCASHFQRASRLQRSSLFIENSSSSRGSVFGRICLVGRAHRHFGPTGWYSSHPVPDSIFRIRAAAYLTGIITSKFFTSAPNKDATTSRAEEYKAHDHTQDDCNPFG
jgi:hypothetical protein